VEPAGWRAKLLLLLPRRHAAARLLRLLLHVQAWRRPWEGRV
jgi:hypothetical protein